VRDSTASRRHRDNWLRNARRKGLDTFRESNYIRLVNRKRAKVLHSNVNPQGVSWFTNPIPAEQADAEGSRDVDVYVLICGTEKHFYVIARTILIRFAKNSKTTIGLNRKQILLIKPKANRLKIGDSKWRKISKYLNYWTYFKTTNIKPNSRSIRRNRFEKSVESWLKNVVSFRKRSTYLLKKTKVVGRSGNKREIDFAIQVRDKHNNNSKIRILMELKSFGQLKKNPSDPTFKAHMDRAFSLLGDFAGHPPYKKFVIVPKKANWGKLSFDKMFNIIGVRIIEFKKTKSRSYLENIIRRS
jgi:hypothetical protein